MNWKDSASTVRWNIRPFIDGRYADSTANVEYDNINPATETILCRVAAGCAKDIDQAVQVGRKRFIEGCWSKLPPTRRALVLVKLADLIERNKAQIALLDTLEMGKPIRGSIADAEIYSPFLLRSWAGFSDKVLGESAPMYGGSISFNTYEPRGVVGAITPWNFPSVNAVYKFGPALAAGNSVVLKPSEIASSSALMLAELALEAGLPEGVFNVVPGLGSTVGIALAQHPDVDMLSFTGSTETGRKIMEVSGRCSGRPVLLECGGKSPQIVFDDVDNLDAVAESAAQSFLWNQGQVCSAHTRLLVHTSKKAALLEKIVERARLQRPGDPLEDSTSFGPLASPGQRDRVKGFIEKGLKAGASAVLRGTIQDSGGCYVSPTIFDRVESTMAIAREEIFGPVLCVLDFRNEEEAIALANATPFGLAANIWTKDLGRAKRMAREVRAGSVSVHTSGPEEEDSGCVLSFEAQRASGFGAELGRKGLESYSTLKLVSFLGA